MFLSYQNSLHEIIQSKQQQQKKAKDKMSYEIHSRTNKDIVFILNEIIRLNDFQKKILLLVHSS